MQGRRSATVNRARKRSLNSISGPRSRPGTKHWTCKSKSRALYLGKVFLQRCMYWHGLHRMLGSRSWQNTSLHNAWERSLSFGICLHHYTRKGSCLRQSRRCAGVKSQGKIGAGSALALRKRLTTVPRRGKNSSCEDSESSSAQLASSDPSIIGDLCSLHC